MVKCIKCGKELIPYGFPIKLEGYQCNNPDCPEYNKPWTLAEHKDNQNWAVRHIRLLESKTQALEQENADLKTKLENLIQQLEIALGTDLDGSN